MRHGFTLGIVLAVFLVLVMATPTPNHQVDLHFLDLPQHLEYHLAGDQEEFVENNASNVDSSDDKGTHSEFSNEQAKDSTYDTLTEENTDAAPTDYEHFTNATSNLHVPTDKGSHDIFADLQSKDATMDTMTEADQGTAGNDVETFVNIQSDLHAESDIGTHSLWTELNDKDTTYDTLTEGNTGGAGGTEWLSVNAFDSTWDGFDITAGDSPWLGAQDQPTHMRGEMASGDVQLGWFDFPSTSLSGSITVNISCYTHNSDGVGDDWFDVYVDYTGSGAGADVGDVGQHLDWSYDTIQLGSHSAAEVNALRVYFVYKKSGGGDDVWIDHCRLGLNVASGDVFDLDLEVGWNNADFDETTGEEICVFASTQGSEALRVDVWTGSWTNVIVDVAVGWNNVSVASWLTDATFEMRFTDTTNDAVEADAWLIDCVLLHCWTDAVVDYELDLEIRFTQVDFDETYEELCVYGGSQNAEALKVDIWDGGAWQNVIADVTASAWNNVSVTTYVTGASIEVRFWDADQADDSSLSTWDIDAVLLHLWSDQTYNYEIDLEVQWTTATYTETNEQVCIYVGTMNAENLTVWEWGAAAWQSLGEMDVTGSMWYNFTASYLTAATYTIRFLGDSESADATESTWQIDAVLLHTWTTVGNDAPVNDTQPTCANLDDTDNLYAKAKQYSIITYVSDAQGFADINYLELSLYSDDRGTLYWTVRYDEDTNTFTEQTDPSDYITLDTGGSSAVESGNDIDATFLVTINWNHPDFADADFKAYVLDDEPTSDTDWYQDVGGWDYETRLDYSLAPAVREDDAGTVDRGDLDEAFTLNGTIIYYGGTVNPPSDQVDVWISASQYGSNVGPWSDLTLTSGTFSATCYADDAVGQDTYTVKTVIEAAGSGGTDLYYTTSVTDTYIADEITVQTTVADDSHVNINDNVEIRVTLWLAYNAETLGSGDTVTLNDTSMVWDASNSWFDLTRTQASIGQWKYFVNSSSETGHGVTGLNLDSNDVSVIWNSLTVSLTNPTDQHIDISTNASGMVPSAVYDYGGGAYDGTFTMNNTQYSYATAQKQGYKVSSADGDDAHGITTISSNADETHCIWNSLTTIISDPMDQHINVAANASGMLISATYDYGGGAYDGNLTLNDEDYAHSVVGNYSYYVSAGDGDDSYGVTAVSSYNETWCVFTRLIWTIVPDDSTPDNDVEVTFTLSVIFDHDDSACTTYKLTITRDTVHWYTFTNENKSLFVDTAASLDYDYDVGSIVSESEHGITAEYGLGVTVTWSAAGSGEGEWELDKTENNPAPIDISGIVGIGIGGALVVTLVFFVCIGKREVYYE